MPIDHTYWVFRFHLSKESREKLEMLLNNTEDEKNDYYLAISYHLLGNYDNALKCAEMALSNPEITQFDYMAYKLHVIQITTTINRNLIIKRKLKR
jgi:tetratricopeptide (TPR) repeat protein